MEGDPEPVALARAPAKDAGADHFWRAGHRIVPANEGHSGDVGTPGRLAVVVQDWGLAALYLER